MNVCAILYRDSYTAELFLLHSLSENHIHENEQIPLMSKGLGTAHEPLVGFNRRGN